MHIAQKVYNVYILVCKIITKNNSGKNEPAGKRFCANLKNLTDNTDSEKNIDDEEIDVTVDKVDEDKETWNLFKLQGSTIGVCLLLLMYA